MTLKKQLKTLVTELVQLRRDFHQYPELGFNEFKTGDKIATYLDNLGIEIKRIAKTGVVGILNGGKQGRTILLRSDMDALPIQEETGLVFQSVHPGVMHACGHDGHMAMLLVAAKLLAAIGILPDSKQVSGRIRTMAGEDFSEFANKVPSAFAFIGIGNPCNKTTYPHHHPRFDIDETALTTGAELYATITLEFLQETF